MILFIFPEKDLEKRKKQLGYVFIPSVCEKNIAKIQTSQNLIRTLEDLLL